MTNREQTESFIQALQDLSSVINEEVGELTKAINNVVFRKDKIITPSGDLPFASLEEIWEELRDTFPPLVELYNVLRCEKNAIGKSSVKINFD